MSWALHVTPSGLIEIDLRAFVPAGSRVISEHEQLRDARDAKEVYAAKLEREALSDAGQRDLFSGLQ